MRGGWSDPDVAGTSAMVARVTALNITAPSDRAVGCPAWDGDCHREMVDDWIIYELTIYELVMVVVYMYCAYVLLCIFCSQSFSRFASLSGVFPHKLVWGIGPIVPCFEHVRAAGGGGGSVTIGPFYMVVLVGYSIAGICIVVVGCSRQMSGCLGNLVMCQVPTTTVAGQATTRGRLAVCLGSFNRSPPRRWRAKRQHVGGSLSRVVQQ